MEAPKAAVHLNLEKARWRAALSANTVRWLLVLILAWSAGGKLFWPERFGGLLRGLGMIPQALVAPIQYGLPPLELILALALASHVGRTAALFATIFLGLAFAGVHGLVLISGTVVPCGCAGIAVRWDSPWAHVLVATVCGFMAVSSTGLLFSDRPGAPSRCR